MVEASIPMAHSIAGNGDDDGFAVHDLLAAGHQVINHFKSQKPSCENNAIAFGYSRSAAVGVFGGAEIHQHGVTGDILKKLLDYAEENSVSKTTLVQLCKAGGRAADYGIGIVASSSKNLSLIQEVVKTWVEGRCFEVEDGEDWTTVTLRVPESKTEKDDESLPVMSPRSRLVASAECRTTTVEAGDGCWAVADRCGITQSNLEKYNPRPNFCSTLVVGEVVCCTSGILPDTIPPANKDGTCKTTKVVKGDGCGSLADKCGLSPADFTEVNPGKDLCAKLVPGQHVCCSRGDLPDLRPKPNPGDSCATYTTIADDNCSKIGANFGPTQQELEDFNKKTWGWNGCNLLFPDYTMCVSEGTPPMPAPVSNAICGPTVPGTKPPSGDKELADLNPCPLKVCCNIWGQCGMNKDFCTISESESGAPGTSKPGENGCISNCGREIVKGSAPSEKIHVAYFEAWNHNRECLTMDVGQIDTDEYTHVHFAFVDITRDFNMDITSVKEQFGFFKKMTGIKKIVSFGGWDFSTLPGTFNILRQAVKKENRPTFQRNIIAFMEEHDLDGVDLGWEYPGAPDIPDIPAGDPEAGIDYYEFLAALKGEVGDSKTVSFAAPASYHYLKSYPIEKMAKELDYIIYMTYDLHGQWDYGNEWTTSGCPNGNCLRSHVNETETKDALAMITKAGAPSNKVVVGVTSYGRSFKMAEAGCTRPMCRFTGTPRESNAAKGRCTDTGGYISNAEINEIVGTERVTKEWIEEGSNILVYDETEWVAYMDDEMKASRSEFYDSYNFAGTTDWAVDLQIFVDGSGGSDDYPDDYEPEIDLDYFAPCNKKYTTLKQLEDRSIPPHCMEKYIVDVELEIMGAALKRYKDLVDDGYDDKFNTYHSYIVAQIPLQIDAFMRDNADKYFSCEQYKLRVCCSDCKYATCAIDCVRGDDCDSGYGYVDIKCQDAIRDDMNVTFTATDSKGFWEALGKEYGVEQAWTKTGRKNVHISNGCQYAGERVLECAERRDHFLWNYPVARDKKDVDVHNPKDIIGDSYPKHKDLLARLKIIRNHVDTGLTQWSDLVDAGSLPALSIHEAVKSMDAIADKAEEIKRREREQMILSFITGFLFLIPLVGQAVGGAGMTAVRAMLNLIGGVGEAGVALYEVVNDPKNAFMTVFGYLATMGVGRRGVENAANSRRAMGSKELDALGAVKKSLDVMQDLRGKACKR